MKIRLTEAARNRLEKQELPDGTVPRLDAEMTGGCGVSVRLLVVFDEPRRNDAIVDCGGGLCFWVDRFTGRYAETETTIDYTETSGFVVNGLLDSRC